MDILNIIGMTEAYSHIRPSEDTQAIWAKLVSSYGEDKAAAILIGLVDQLGKDYFDQLAKISTLENEIAGLERDKGIKTYRSQVEIGQVKPAKKVSASQIEALYKRGLTVKEITQRLGVSRSTVWRNLKDYKERKKKIDEECKKIFIDDDDEVEDTRKKVIMTTEEIFGD